MSAQFKNGDLCWIDGKYLGQYIGPWHNTGWSFVATFGTEFNIAHRIDDRRIFKEQASEFVTEIVPSCCENL